MIRNPRKNTSSHPALGSVHADEVMPLSEFGRRMGLRSRALADIQRRGLRTVLFGRMKYVLGRDALAFFDSLGKKGDEQ